MTTQRDTTEGAGGSPLGRWVMQQTNARDHKFDGPWKSKATKTAEQGAGKRAKRIKASELKKQSIAGLKRSLNYDVDVPRCETCVHFRKAGSILINSLPRWFGPRCKLHSFNVRPVACCDDWADQRGNELAA